MHLEPPTPTSVASGKEGKPEESRSERTFSFPPSKHLLAKHLVLLMLFSALLAVAVNWPAVAHLTTRVPNSHGNLRKPPPPGKPSLGDPLLVAWAVAWDGHALIHQPLQIWDANVLWPLRHSLAFSDAFLGYAPVGAIGSGAQAALVRYNLLFLFSYGLAFVGAYLLATELGAGWEGGAATGAAFAFNSWRLAQNGHLHVLSSGGIPLALWLLVRGWRNRRPRQVLAGWLVATWQLSIGFTLGIPFAYLLAVLTLAAIAAWMFRGRPPLGRAFIAASVLGIAIFIGWALLQAAPYLAIVKEFPGAKRSLATATRYSPPPVGYLSAPDYSLVWGRVTGSLRDHLNAPGEQAMFPGAIITLLALWGLLRSRHRRALRCGLLAGVLIFGVLALGFRPLNGDLGYRFLWLHAPGWDSSRTPGRVVTFGLLGLALLGGLGAQDLLQRLTLRARATPRVVIAVLGLVVGGILIEGTGSLPTQTIPAAPPSLSLARPPLLELPTSGGFDHIYMYWSTEGFPYLVNAQSGYSPCILRRVRRVARTFPDAPSIGFLRSIGVNSVVLHTNLVRGTRWSNTAEAPIEGLGITREQFGSLVIYALGDRPPSRAGLDLGRCAPRTGP
jgi:hypothetical protein